ncbi:MAG: hypothetical protein JNK82_28295 [Myxococcaceae bacterium]|nr:hypothetical protein [Myxococcaceae bacterium]
MRLLCLAALTSCALLTGCGTVCDTAMHAEQRANQKGRDCNAGNITVHDANTSNSGLSKCSQDDMREIQLYAECLDALPVCTSSNSTSFAFQRLGCVAQPIGRISASCAAAIF